MKYTFIWEEPKAGEWFGIYQLIGRNPCSEESWKLSGQLCSLYKGPGIVGELGEDYFSSVLPAAGISIERNR